MVAKEEEDENAEEGSQGHYYDRDYLAVSELRLVGRLVQILRDVYSSKNDAIANAEEDRPQEEEEVLIVPLPDARPNPGTVMVQSLDAAATQPAVNSPRRSIYVALLAVLDSRDPPIQDVHVLLLPWLLGGIIDCSLVCFE